MIRIEPTIDPTPMHPLPRSVPLAVLAALIACSAPDLAAQAPYPNRPVQIVVPYPAGGGADVVVRGIAHRLAEVWGRNVVIDNRPGASGMIGTEMVTRMEADGHTLLGHTSSYPATAAIRIKLPFDPARSIASVAMIAKAPLVLAVHPSVPARSAKELVALAARLPGKLNYSSAGAGGNNHYAASLFASAAGVSLTHIPYKGVAPAAVALVSGEVEMLFASSPAIGPQVKAGRLRALGVTSLQPSPLLPDLPTIAQTGVPGYHYELWWALFAPAGIAADRLNTINAAVNKVLAGADMKKFLSDQGAEPWPLSAAQLRDLLPNEIDRYRKIAREAGIAPE
jgi:tripartite-type tricarboxylate transporter receptor subunit TctC